MQIGDIVYLKSGSLPMTVVAPDGKNWVVQWSMGSALTTANIPEGALIAKDPRQQIAADEETRAMALRPAKAVEDQAKT